MSVKSSKGVPDGTQAGARPWVSSSALSVERVPLSLAFALTLASTLATAQELEPRAYSPSPVGAHFVVLGIGRLTGSIVTDATLPVTDAHADVNAATIGLGRTFGIRGKQALVTVALPYSWGVAEGKVGEESRRVTRSGLADLRLKLSVNLRGGPALAPREFAKSPRRTIIGTSITVSAPTGQYDATKLVNLGTNRWAVKPELGVSHPVGRWYFDAYAGLWLFSVNDKFYPGDLERSQDPVFGLQGHASYTFRPRLWIALDATWYRGGEATIGNQPPSGFQSNSRAGATLSLPLGSRQSVKITYNNGVSVRTGTNFTAVGVAWQLSWFNWPR